MVRPPKKASRGFIGGTRVSSSTNALMLRILLFETIPLTAPDGDDVNVTITNSLETSHGVAIHGVHTTIVETTVRFLSIGETRRTPVPKAAQVLVSGVGRLVVAVHGPTGARDLIFALVACMTDTWLSGLLCLQLMFLPLQPFHGFLGIIGDQTPTTERFGSDGVFLHAVKTEIVHAHTGCGHFFKGAETCQFFDDLVSSIGVGGTSTFFAKMFSYQPNSIILSI